MAVTKLSGPWGKLLDEKNQRTQISCPCTFKSLRMQIQMQVYRVNRVIIKVQICLGPGLILHGHFQQAYESKIEADLGLKLLQYTAKYVKLSLNLNLLTWSELQYLWCFLCKAISRFNKELVMNIICEKIVFVFRETIVYSEQNCFWIGC